MYNDKNYMEKYQQKMSIESYAYEITFSVRKKNKNKNNNNIIRIRCTEIKEFKNDVI